MADEQIPHPRNGAIPPTPLYEPTVSERRKYLWRRITDFSIGFFGSVAYITVNIVLLIYLAQSIKDNADPVSMVLLSIVAVIFASAIAIQKSYRVDRRYIAYGIITVLAVAFLTPCITFGWCLLALSKGFN